MQSWKSLVSEHARRTNARKRDGLDWMEAAASKRIESGPPLLKGQSNELCVRSCRSAVTDRSHERGDACAHERRASSAGGAWVTTRQNRPRRARARTMGQRLQVVIEENLPVGWLLRLVCTERVKRLAIDTSHSILEARTFGDTQIWPRTGVVQTTAANHCMQVSLLRTLLYIRKPEDPRPEGCHGCLHCRNTKTKLWM